MEEVSLNQGQSLNIQDKKSYNQKRQNVQEAEFISRREFQNPEPNNAVCTEDQTAKHISLDVDGHQSEDSNTEKYASCNYHIKGVEIHNYNHQDLSGSEQEGQSQVVNREFHHPNSKVCEYTNEKLGALIQDFSASELKMHNTSKEPNSNTPKILITGMSECTKYPSNHTEEVNRISSTLDSNQTHCYEEIKKECVQGDEWLQNHLEENVTFHETINEQGQQALTDKEIMNLNELVIESEKSMNVKKSSPKKRGRPKSTCTKNVSSSKKSKTMLHNKKGRHLEVDGSKDIMFSNSELTKESNAKNKFKGVKEMRVRISKLNASNANGETGGKRQSASKNIQTKNTSKRKKAGRVCSESKSPRKKISTLVPPNDIDVEIKQEPESSEEDNSANDPDYFPIKEEPELPTQGRKKHRIGRPPKLGNHSCKKCSTIFPTKKLLQEHQKVHSIPKQSCRFCDFEAKSVVVMMEHEAKHTLEKPFKCEHPDCEYASRSNVDLQRHKSKHSTEKKYKCPHENCDFVTKWQRNIHHHVLRHTDERPYPCHLCTQSFKRVQDLKYHLYRHNDDKPIGCDTCDFKCKTNFELKCHKLKHSDVRNYACTFPGCTQRTKSKSDLTKHMKIHSDKKDFICDECGKGFRTKACLSKHLQRHSDERPFSCYICNRAFKVKVALRKHVALHSEYRPFSCEMCGQKFSSKSNKNIHMKTHDYSDRPYPCPVCPYAAKIQSHLLSHIGSMHGNAYAYFCEICKKPFKRYGQLKVHHVRMHPEVDFGKLKSESAIMQRKMKDGTVIDFAFENDTLANVEECINNVITDANRDNEVPTGKEISVILPDVQQIRETDHKSDYPEVNMEIVSASDPPKMEKRKRGRPKKIKPCIDIQKLEVKQEDLKIQSDAEKLHENLILSEKLAFSAENHDLKNIDIFKNLDAGVILTPVSQNELSCDLPSKDSSKMEKDTPRTPATLTIYEGGFRLPLATKGFRFNFDKTGKKPKSWFMNPDNMHKGAREHQMKYLARKDTEYKYYLRAQRKKMFGRNKVLESLERRRKSAAKRFATTSTPLKRRHGKVPFRFTKVIEEGEIVRKGQKTSSNKQDSLLDSISSQTLPKLIFKKFDQEEYQCYEKEENNLNVCFQNNNTESERRSDAKEQNDAVLPDQCSHVNTVDKSTKARSHNHFKVCFKKRGRPKKNDVNKDISLNGGNKPSNKTIQNVKNSRTKRKKPLQKPQNQDAVLVSQEKQQTKKKRGRPRKNESLKRNWNSQKSSQKVNPTKKSGRKPKKGLDSQISAAMEGSSNPATGKRKRTRKQKGESFVKVHYMHSLQELTLKYLFYFFKADDMKMIINLCRSICN